MKLKLLTIVLISALTSLLADPIEIGTPAPQLKAVDHTGTTIDFGQELATGTTVVFFYPKALTPGCTKQACSLRDGWDQLQQLEVKVYGVSSDKAKTQAQFRDKHQLPFALLADTDGAISKAFGKGKWSRQAYIFKDGKLVWRDTSAATAKQFEEVLAALQDIL